MQPINDIKVKQINGSSFATHSLLYY